MNDFKNSIGETAGKVYQYLEVNGESSLIELENELNSKFTKFAVGWLMKEEKIELFKKGLFTRIKLVD